MTLRGELEYMGQTEPVETTAPLWSDPTGDGLDQDMGGEQPSAEAADPDAAVGSLVTPDAGSPTE